MIRPRRSTPPRLAVLATGPIADAHLAAAHAAGWPLVDHHEAEVVVVIDHPDRAPALITELLASHRAVIAEPPWCRTTRDADIVAAAQQELGRPILHAEHLCHAPTFRAFTDEIASLHDAHLLEVRSLGLDPRIGSDGAGDLARLGQLPVALALVAARRIGSGAPIQVACSAHAGQFTIDVQWSSGLRSRILCSASGSRSRTCDVQLATPTVVVRADLLGVPSLERNGEHQPLPSERTRPAEIERYGHLGQLAALADALDHGAAPLTDAGFAADVQHILARAVESLGDDAGPPG